MEKKRKACAEGEEGDPQAENARLQQQLQELTAENAQLTKLGSGPAHFGICHDHAQHGAPPTIRDARVHAYPLHATDAIRSASAPLP
jgi:hypothetical protein